MTYKHINFSDSVVMRSFEKEAIKKGLVVPEPAKQIKKEASAKTISEDFNSNLLVLCAQLRKTGYEKYANEIEKNYMILKAAEADLYDISKETGDQLLDEAHPEGGNQIVEDGELGYVETRTEARDKIHAIVNKEPKGKLSTASEIVDEVKKILSE